MITKKRVKELEDAIKNVKKYKKTFFSEEAYHKALDYAIKELEKYKKGTK